MGRDAASPEATHESKTSEHLERAVVCRACKHVLTNESQRLEIGGRHQHTFVNPHAYAFTIVCFKTAPGCVGFGERSTYWSWFEGHAWRIALCGGCSAHVGWSFEGDSSFFGLVARAIA